MKTATCTFVMFFDRKYCDVGLTGQQHIHEVKGTHWLVEIPGSAKCLEGRRNKQPTNWDDMQRDQDYCRCKTIVRGRLQNYMPTHNVGEQFLAPCPSLHQSTGSRQPLVADPILRRMVARTRALYHARQWSGPMRARERCEGSAIERTCK